MDVLTRRFIRDVVTLGRSGRASRRLLCRSWQALVEQRRQRVKKPAWVLADPDALASWRNAGSPAVSIVIPVHNQIPTTLECLRSVIGAGSGAPLELVVVDDASTEPDASRLRGYEGITYHRNDANLGFVGSCNAGALLSRGKFLVFLNSDTLVTPGWLEPLLARLGEPGIGLVGACLQYPDGTLQEAGGLVFADGSAWNYGRGGHPGDPRYLSRRDVHYCSGAVLALTRERYHALGGFDRLFAPGYYEDTDLAMRVRASGARVVYEPESVVVHMEGMSAGTDIAAGMKSAQAVNRGKFQARWCDTLQRKHPAAGSDPDLAVRQAGKGWVVAYTGDVSDSRLFATLEVLAGDCAVDLFLDAEPSAWQLRQLRARGVTVWPPHWKATGRWLLTRIGSGADVVLTDGSAPSDAWLRQMGADLPAARRLRLVPAGALAVEAGNGTSPVSGAEELLELLPEG